MFDGSMHLNGSSNSHSQEQPKKTCCSWEVA